jgi:hypothetical protein
VDRKNPQLSAAGKIGSRANRHLTVFCACCALLFTPGLLAAQSSSDDGAGQSSVFAPYSLQQAAANGLTELQPSNAPTTPPVTVHGVVRNASTGQPLPRALVRIESTNQGALTDGDGQFEFAAVPSGSQTFQVQKPGFRDQPMSSGGLVEDFDGPNHIVLVAAEMPEVVFSLAPTSSIRGHIELSTGDPGEGIGVALLKQVIESGRATWAMADFQRTNSEGEFRFGGLSDGVYVIYTRPSLESEPATTLIEAGKGERVAQDGFPTVFYPDARDLAGAARIRISGGEQVQANMILTLETFHSVTATAVPADAKRSGGSNSGRNDAGYAAAIMDQAGRRLPYVAQYDAATDTIQASLPDGTYTLLVSREVRFRRYGFGGDVAVVQDTPAGPVIGSVDFTVAGHAVTNLRIPLTARPTHTVHVREIRTGAAVAAQPAATQNNGIQSTVNVSLTQMGDLPGDGGTETGSQEAGPDTLELTASNPGSWWVHTRTLQPGVCVDSFTAAGANLAHEPLVLSLAGTSAPMELALRDDCAKLTVVLPALYAAPVAGEEAAYTVYVVPDFESTADVDAIKLRPGTASSVTVDGLTPGSYHVYTFEQPITLEYRNRNVLAALPNQGQQVTLAPGAAANLVLEVPGH